MSKINDDDDEDDDECSITVVVTCSRRRSVAARRASDIVVVAQAAYEAFVRSSSRAPRASLHPRSTQPASSSSCASLPSPGPASPLPSCSRNAAAPLTMAGPRWRQARPGEVDPQPRTAEVRTRGRAADRYGRRWPSPRRSSGGQLSVEPWPVVRVACRGQTHAGCSSVSDLHQK